MGLTESEAHVKNTEPYDLVDLVHAVVQDPQDVALYTVLAEARLGIMPAETVDGDATALDRDDCMEVALGGIVMLEGGPARVGWYLPQVVAAEEMPALLRTLYGLAVDPAAKGEYKLAFPPRSVAAIIVYRAGDGTRCTRVHRHPGLTHDQALLYLRQQFKDQKPSETPAPVGPTAARN